MKDVGAPQHPRSSVGSYIITYSRRENIRTLESIAETSLQQLRGFASKLVTAFEMPLTSRIAGGEAREQCSRSIRIGYNHVAGRTDSWQTASDVLRFSPVSPRTCYTIKRGCNMTVSSVRIDRTSNVPTYFFEKANTSGRWC